MLKRQVNKRKQGDVGLGIAIGWFSSMGYTVSVPLTDNQEYDLIVDDVQVYKIQVKTTYNKERNGSYKVELRNKGGQYKKGVVDYFFILTEEGTKYLIPIEVLEGKQGIVLSDKYSEYLIQ